MDIYFHELRAYEREIQLLKSEIEVYMKNPLKVDNLTHFSLGVSNRGNLMLVGLCSLVEVFLYELVSNEEKKQLFKLEDLKGSGLIKLKNYLSKTKRVNFGKIRNWGKFKNIYTLRNTIVHSYGGLVETARLDKTRKTLKALKLESSLIGNRRIRLTTETLLDFHKIIESIINDLKENT